MRQAYARRVFVRPIKSNTLDSLTVYKTTHEHHHDRQEHEDEENRRADAHPLPESIVINSTAVLVSRVAGETWVHFCGCGQRSAGHGRG